VRRRDVHLEWQGGGEAVPTKGGGKITVYPQTEKGKFWQGPAHEVCEIYSTQDMSREIMPLQEERGGC